MVSSGDVVGLGGHAERDRPARGIAGPLPIQRASRSDSVRPPRRRRSVRGTCARRRGRSCRRGPRGGRWGVGWCGGGHAVSWVGVVSGRWAARSRTVRRTSRSRPSSDGLVEAGAGSRSASQSTTGGQAGALEPVVPLAAPVGRGHQTGLAEHAEVATDGRPADGVVGRKVDDPGRAAGEPVDQVPTYGVAEGCERIHDLLVTLTLPICQGLCRAWPDDRQGAGQGAASGGVAWTMRGNTSCARSCSPC